MVNLTTDKGVVIIGKKLSPVILDNLTLHEELTSFRQPREQHSALIEITKLTTGRVYGCIHNQTIVGYVTFHPSEPDCRWGNEIFGPGIIELGGMEVAKDWRNYGLCSLMLKEVFQEEYWEDFIVIALHLYWHWDLKGTNLDVWNYRKMLSRIMEKNGFRLRSTDEGEIRSHPANMLKVRIGKKVPKNLVSKFETSIYKDRWMF